MTGFFLKNKIQKLTIYMVLLSVVVTMLVPSYVVFAETTTTDTTSFTSFTVQYTNVNAGVLYDSGVKRDGAVSLKMYNRTQYQNGNIFMIYQQITVEKGKTYECGVSVKGEDVNSAQMVFANYDLNKSLKPFGETFDWIDLKFKYKHHRASGRYPFHIMVNDVATALWVDNLYMYELDEDGNRLGANLFQNNSFEKRGTKARAAVTAGGSSNTILVHNAPENLKIDGKLDEWEDSPSYKFEAARNQYLLGIPNDIEANVQYFFDENYFYFAITADDSKHVSFDASDYWNVDSVQYSISKTDEAYGRELGLVYVEDTDESFSYGFNGIEFKGSRTDNQTFYEAAIPWKVREWEEVPEKFLFGAIMNNNQGHGRLGTVEYTGGVSSGKTNAGFVSLIPFDSEIGVLAALEAHGEVKAGEVSDFSVLVINGYKEAKDICVSIPQINYNETFHVEGNGTHTAVFEHTMEKSGDIELQINLSCDNQKRNSVKQITVLPNNEAIKKFCDDLNEKCKLLEKKIYECSKKGNYVDYEMTNLEVIKLYISYLEDDLAHSIYNYAANTYKYLVGIYDESMKNLEAYMNGEKESFYVPKIQSGDYTIEDGGFRANVMLENGKVEKSPVFYVGFNDFGNALPPERCGGTGVNIVEVSIDTRYGITPDTKILCYTPSNEEYCEIVEDEKASGKYSIKISVPEKEKFTLAQRVDVEYLKEYEVSFKVKGENVSEGYFKFGNDAIQTFSGTFDWTEYKLTTTIAGMEISRAFNIVCQGADNLWIDDISIVKKGGGYQCVQNSGFEMGYGGQSERGYVFVDAFAEKMNYIINEYYNQGVAVNLNGPGYLEGDVLKMFMEKDPLYRNSINAFYSHPLWIEYAIYFFTEFLKRVDVDKIFSLTLANEPNHRANTEFHKPMWSDYLKEKYNNDLSALNLCHGAEYESFDVVPFPITTNDTTNLFNDWMHFNNKLLVDYWVILREEVRKVAPNLNCQTKIMEYVFKGDKRLNYGNDYELWSDLFEINGCDSYSYKDLPNYPIVSRLEWYDFLTSNKDVPVCDTELHVMPDGIIYSYDEKLRNYTLADYWQCSIHKLGGTTLWLMDRGVDTFRMQHIFESTNFTLMPELYAAVLKSHNDLQRLAKEITALQNRKADAAILFSHNAIQKNIMYTNDLHVTYTNILNKGEKVFIMNETRPELIIENGIKVLFLPGATHVRPSTADAIKKFIEQGGMVVMTEDDLKYDEHDNPLNSETVDYIHKNAHIIKPLEGEKSADMWERMVKYGVDKLNLAEIKICYADSGEEIKNSEFEYTSYNGKTILNICNYDWDTSKEINVYYQGQKITNFKELITGNKYGENIMLEPYVPILLEF